MNIKSFGFKSYVGLNGEFVYAMRMTKSSKSEIFSFLSDFLYEDRVQFRDGNEREEDNRIQWWRPGVHGIQILYIGEFIVIRGGVSEDGEFEFRNISNFASTDTFDQFMNYFVEKH